MITFYRLIGLPITLTLGLLVCVVWCLTKVALFIYTISYKPMLAFIMNSSTGSEIASRAVYVLKIIEKPSHLGIDLIYRIVGLIRSLNRI